MHRGRKPIPHPDCKVGEGFAFFHPQNPEFRDRDVWEGVPDGFKPMPDGTVMASDPVAQLVQYQAWAL